MNDHPLQTSSSSTGALTGAGQATPLPQPGSFGALVARVPYNQVTLPVAGLIVLLGLGFGGLLVYRQVYRRRSARPGVPSK
jgi:hypothetical protein